MTGKEKMEELFDRVNAYVQRGVGEDMSLTVERGRKGSHYRFEVVIPDWAVSDLDECGECTPAIRPMAIVRYIFDERFKDHWKYSPFVEGRDYIFLGEIAQMPGHGVFMDMETGQNYSGYHIDEFEEVDEDEA